MTGRNALDRARWFRGCCSAKMGAFVLPILFPRVPEETDGRRADREKEGAGGQGMMERRGNRAGGLGLHGRTA